MFKLVAVTNRHLCRIPFLDQLRHVAAAGVDALILREKDLTPAAYANLAKEVKAICRQNQVDFIAHTFVQAALECSTEHIHLPLPVLTADPDIARKFTTVGVSVHSVAEARQAAALDAGYLIAGHVFATACKADAPPRGLNLLGEIKTAVTLPLYAIGGITPQNVFQVRQSGIQGACLMSSLMQAEDPASNVTMLKAAANDTSL